MNMTLEQIATFVSIIGTLVTGFTFIVKGLSKGISKLIQELSKNHAENMSSAMKEIRNSEKLEVRVQKLEEESKTLGSDVHTLTELVKTNQSNIMEKLDTTNDRIDAVMQHMLGNK